MPQGASELLKDVGRLLTRSHDLEETLANVVRLVARWMRAGGCSIYLVEDDGQTLVLRATKGLRPQAVGSVRLRVGEGIVGSCLEIREPIAAADAAQDARWHPFPESGESRFRSLLAVPLFVRQLPVGVLTVQTARPRDYTRSEIELLETIAGQVATIVLNARLLDMAFREGSIAVPQLAQPAALPPGTVLGGIPMSPGLAEGPIHLQPPPIELDASRYTPARSRRSEWRELEAALRESVRQISDLRSAVGERFGEEFAEVFTTHIMILEDEGFREKLRRQVFEHGNGLKALVETMQEYTAVFSKTQDQAIRERAADFEDVVRRVVGELVGVKAHNAPLRDGVIVVADRIAPSEFVLLETEKVAGLITAHGGPTSHAAIFARSLEIPAVTGLSGLLDGLRGSDRVLLDGFDGQVIVNPGARALRDLGERRHRYARARARLDELAELPCRDLDGHEVTLSANIGGLNDLELIKRYGARGIGLFRTEILALSSRGFPDEEEQIRIYRRVAETVAPDSVNVRTFDLGGDKALPGQEVEEENPQLGWRSLRMLLDLKDVFRAQLRAIMRANTPGNLRILIPMVTSMDDLDATRAILREACDEIGVAEPPPIGVMIETPAAVGIVDSIAREVEFLSIGTNDLIQYMLAVDRENERVSAAYDPFHPAVLNAIRRVSEVAQREGISCAVCGELAGNPVATPVLLGMGIRELSMTPFWVMAVRQLVRAVRISEAEQLARDVAGCARASEVRARIAEFMAQTGVLDDPDFGPPLLRLLAPRSRR